MIQTPDSSPIKCLLALFHAIEDDLTTCFFYSASPIHLFQFQDLIPKLLDESYQPIIFPVAFLKVYNEYIEGYRKFQDYNIVYLEEGLGQTKYYQYRTNEARNPRNNIKRINGIS